MTRRRAHALPGPRGLPVLAALALAGCPKTPTDYQREHARTLRPAGLEAAPVLPPEIKLPRRTFRVRILVDEDYQEQVGRWGPHASGQVGRAARVLEAQFGIQLDVEEVRPWKHGGGSPDVFVALGELAAADPGRGVDWVVGFVSRAPGLVTAKEQLGAAHLGGRHLVVRGMPNFDEAREVHRIFDKLPAEERERLVLERQQHRETAVLLHEWGHLLGAEHDESSRWLMAPLYDPAQSAFSPEGVARIAAGLLRMDAPTAAPAAPPTAPLGPAVPPPAPTRSAPPLPAEDRKLLEQVSAQLRRGRQEEAARLLAPLAARRLDDARIQALSCSVAVQRAPRAKETLDACRLAALLEDASPEVRLTLADLHLGRGKPAEAQPLLARAEAALGSDAAPATWAALARLYDRAGNCTGAERTARRSRDQALAQDVARDCTRLRRTVSLPRGCGAVPEALERDYASLVTELAGAARAKRLDRAAEHRRELAKRFPGAPGVALGDCLIAAAGKDAARARDACAAATEADGEAARAHLARGVAVGSLGDWATARSFLRRSLELDDSIADPWVELARACRELGEQRELDELAARYQKRFGFDLPRPAPPR